MFKRLFFICIFFTGSIFLSFSQPPTPAAPQIQPVVITGGTAHIGDGRVIENALLVFEKGKFTLVGSVDEIAGPKGSNYRFVDATGKHIYPGFIAPNSLLGLVEIEALRATRDYSETTELKPNVRSLIAYSTDSDIIPVVRSNGILMAEIAPSGGRISGQSSVVQLDAWNWEDAKIAADIGIHLNWPVFQTSSFRSGRARKNEDYEDQVRDLETFFAEAKAYSFKIKPDPVNLMFEEMKGLFDGTKKLFIHSDFALTIQESILFAKKFQVKPVIVGGKDAWMIADFLKENDVPVILSDVHSLPGTLDEDIDQPFKTPSMLHQAGVQFCFSLNGSWKQFNLPFQAGHAVGFGLPYEAAVRALTLDAASILGVSKICGSLEIGKDATFIICEGDALDMRTNQVSQAYIQGREISLENKHKALYARFKEKYERQKK